MNQKDLLVVQIYLHNKCNMPIKMIRDTYKSPLLKINQENIKNMNYKIFNNITK